jgi:hypothetical protein
MLPFYVPIEHNITNRIDPILSLFVLPLAPDPAYPLKRFEWNGFIRLVQFGFRLRIPRHNRIVRIVIRIDRIVGFGPEYFGPSIRFGFGISGSPTGVGCPITIGVPGSSGARVRSGSCSFGDAINGRGCRVGRTGRGDAWRGLDGGIGTYTISAVGGGVSVIGSRSRGRVGSWLRLIHSGSPGLGDRSVPGVVG